MISISTTTSNTAGAVVIKDKPESEKRRYPKRIQRSATLDGGAVIADLGFSHGDRTLKIKAELSEAEATKLINIHQTETLVNISIEDGFFSGAIGSLDLPEGQLDMSVLIKEKLSG